MRLLRPQVTRPVGLANRLVVARGPDALRARLEALGAEGIAHVVVDAVADDDLATIAAACANMPLMTGGSAVAAPLPGIWLAEGALGQDGPAARRQEIGPAAVVLSGSCSAMTHRQVAAYRERGGPALRLDPVALATEGLGRALDWLATQPADPPPLVYATAEPAQVRAAQVALGAERASETVEQALAALAVAARGLGARRFVVAGGETAGAVMRALGVERLEIGPEIAPGVPWCFAESAGRPIAVTLKSGNFGAENFFADALAALGP